MSAITRAIQPPRLCKTCLIRQSIQPSSSLRLLHTSRPNSKQFNQYQSRSPSRSAVKTYNHRPNVRPPPMLKVDDFKPKALSSPSAIAKMLARRIDEWAKSVRTTQRLEAYRIPKTISRGVLRSWADITRSTLDKMKTDQEALGGIQELGIDQERLSLAVADDNFSDVLESTYLRSFLTYATRSSAIDSATQRHIQSILEATDLFRLTNQFNYIPARALTRHFHLHIGPTNSGKTYNALKALSRAKTGAYAGPLRLLAHEVWERMNLGTVGGMEEGQGRACNLLTGEERRIVSPDAGLIACTVEMLPPGSASGPYEVVVIDEIQMLGDPQRGGSWTTAVLGVQAKEIHLCGDETTVQLLHQLLEPMGDKITVHNYDRLTPLSVADQSLDGDYNNVQPGDCIVTFSRSNIFAVKKQIESTAGKKCAVVYGALPPETRADQARDFNDENGRAEVLVASDAVGMGLNLKINRIIFEALHKYNGKEDVPLALTQIKQIAGRAGRYGMQRAATDTPEVDDPTASDESPAPGGSVTTLHQADLPLLKALLPQPLPPITRATIDIPSATLASLSSLLAPETPFAELLEHGSQLAILPPKTTLTTNRHRTQLADVVEPLRQYLNLSEMETFSFAPVNQRDARAVAIFEKVVNAYAKDGRVDLLDCYEGSGLIKSLETVEMTLETLSPLPPIEGIGRRLLTPPVIVTSIPSLETLHKTLVLYIWLSFRYDVSFPDRALAVEIKERVETVLDQCLARLPGLRTKKTHERGAEKDGQVKEWRKNNVGPTGLRREIDPKAVRFDRKGGKLPEQKEKGKIEYASKGEDQGRRRREMWKNVGMSGGSGDAGGGKV